MYLKFGFGRATQDAGIEIRRGAMTRNQGKNLVKLYDNQYPEQFISKYLKYYKISKKEFDSIINKYANKKFLKRLKIDGNQNLKLYEAKEVCIIDYGMGNLGSLNNALEYLNTKVVISDNHKTILKSKILFLPGVGSFKKLWVKLKKN